MKFLNLLTPTLALQSSLKLTTAVPAANLCRPTAGPWSPAPVLHPLAESQGSRPPKAMSARRQRLTWQHRDNAQSHASSSKSGPRRVSPLSPHEMRPSNIRQRPTTSGPESPTPRPRPVEDSRIADSTTPPDSKTSALATEQTAGALLPESPGFEQAFAYACMHDPAAYGWATSFLNKIDAVVEKMTAEDADAPSTPLEEMSQLLNRYESVYGRDASEIGSSGHDPFRIGNVILADSPHEGVELREKMNVIYTVSTAWLPQEIQRRAGIEVYDDPPDRHTPIDHEQRQRDLPARERELQAYVASLGLDFPLSIPVLAAYSDWRLASPTAFKYFFGDPPGRITNSRHFEPRVDLFRSAWRAREVEKNARAGVFHWNPDYEAHASLGDLEQHEPRIDEMETSLRNGSCFFVPREDNEWFLENRKGPNRITMTGPSGCADLFIQLMNIFALPLDEKLAGVKAMIGHMHLDEHHSLHEVLSATDGDPELKRHLRYDGSMESLKRLDEHIFDEAKTLTPRFVASEVEQRNRLERDRRLANADPGTPD
jgi:hypothetical protein